MSLNSKIITMTGSGGIYISYTMEAEKQGTGWQPKEKAARV